MAKKKLMTGFRPGQRVTVGGHAGRISGAKVVGRNNVHVIYDKPVEGITGGTFRTEEVRAGGARKGVPTFTVGQNLRITGGPLVGRVAKVAQVSEHGYAVTLPGSKEWRWVFNTRVARVTNNAKATSKGARSTSTKVAGGGG